MTRDIPIFVLGAGRATRFGGNKLSAMLSGKSLGQWAVDAALATGHPVIWIGRDNPDFAPGGVTEQHINPNADQGLGTSVGLAVRLAEARNAPAALITLADMPLVSVEMLDEILKIPAPAAFQYEVGRAGVPALIPARLFAKLGDMVSDAGAGAMLRALNDLTLLTAPDGLLADVDTPEALDGIARNFTQK